MGWTSAIVGERYRILAKIGEGSVTEVFRALDMRLDRTVALRTLREGYVECPAFVQGLEGEAHALARVAHGNIVRVYDYDEAEKRPFIVMEHVPGKKLTELLREHPSMPEGENNRLAWQLLQGLSAVRRAGLADGNVPLHNVLVHYDGALKITGLGTGKAIEAGGADEAGMRFSDSQHLVAEATSHHDLQVVGSMMHRFLSGALLRESERSLEAVARDVDVVGRTPQSKAEELWPSGRHALDAVVGQYRAAERVAAGGAGASDPTTAVPVVTASSPEADTIWFPALGEAAASHATRSSHLSAIRSLLKPEHRERVSACAYDRLNDFGAFWARAGIDASSPPLTLMSRRQNQVERMTGVWSDQTQVSNDQAASQDGWAEIPL